MAGGAGSVQNHRQVFDLEFQSAGSQGYLFSSHYGGKQLFLFSPQGPENGGEIKFFPPRVRNVGGKTSKCFRRLRRAG